ncbi:MAG: PH domain-containing protein, partial [Congregibacter sp.]|nr:PH domain-containing protein [Congregibacter sp.]
MSVGEYEDEPLRGLPEYLPPDETLIWQGEPDFKVMARRVFHVRAVSLYFAALILVHLAFQASGEATLTEVLLGSSWMVGLGILAIGILSLLAFAYARTTV